VQVRTWTADPVSVPSATPLIFGCYGFRSDLKPTCTKTWLNIDVPAAGGNGYFYNFEVLIPTVPQTFFVNYF
jgi:hypothetical protein